MPCARLLHLVDASLRLESRDLAEIESAFPARPGDDDELPML